MTFSNTSLEAEKVSDLEKALSDQGLIVPSVIAMRQWGDFEGWEHQLVLDEARRRFALGARLGAPFIVATPPLENPKTSHLATRYRELLEIGREEGIRPTFEYISFFKSVYTLKRAWEIVQEADDPDATLILDAFHNWNSNSTMQDLRAIPLERISHYHIDDADPVKPSGSQKDPDRLCPGMGRLTCLRKFRFFGKLVMMERSAGTLQLRLVGKKSAGNP